VLDSTLLPPPPPPSTTATLPPLASTDPSFTQTHRLQPSVEAFHATLTSCALAIFEIRRADSLNSLRALDTRPLARSATVALFKGGSRFFPRFFVKDSSAVTQRGWQGIRGVARGVGRGVRSSSLRAHPAFTPLSPRQETDTRGALIHRLSLSRRIVALSSRKCSPLLLP
jgi:hypothetical protein